MVGRQWLVIEEQSAHSLQDRAEWGLFLSVLSESPSVGVQKARRASRMQRRGIAGWTLGNILFSRRT